MRGCRAGLCKAPRPLVRPLSPCRRLADFILTRGPVSPIDSAPEDLIMGAATLTVTLQAVTPLFLAGADSGGAPELRAASFRGALRFWLRALLGAHLGNDLNALHEAESAIFGNPNGASSVV